MLVPLKKYYSVFHEIIKAYYTRNNQKSERTVSCFIYVIFIKYVLTTSHGINSYCSCYICIRSDRWYSYQIYLKSVVAPQFTVSNSVEKQFALLSSLMPAIGSDLILKLFYYFQMKWEIYLVSYYEPLY